MCSAKAMAWNDLRQLHNKYKIRGNKIIIVQEDPPLEYSRQVLTVTINAPLSHFPGLKQPFGY